MLEAFWREIVSETRKWALVGAGVSNSAVSVLIILLVASGHWFSASNQTIALSQLDILKWLGIIFALTNAVVVVSLAGVDVKATAPGGTSFEAATPDVHAHVEGEIKIKGESS